MGINTGVYVLWLYLPETQLIRIGKLGTFPFSAGVYAYVGSAQRNLKQRVARHARLEKKLHWHIDYFRDQAEFLGAVLFSEAPKIGECLLARGILQIPGSFSPVSGFGSSDCGCVSHLLKVPCAHPRNF